MRIGIVGGPNCGKTTVFNALTRSGASTAAFTSGQVELHTAVVDVPDARLDLLGRMFAPRKAVHSQVTYHDISGVAAGRGRGGGISGPLLNAIAVNDALLLVARAFEDSNVPHPEDRIDPAADLERMEGEFLLADLVLIEGRLQRIAAQRTRGQLEERQRMAREEELLSRLYPMLEQGTPLRSIALDSDELKLLSGFGFLSQRPLLRVINGGDEDSEASFADLLDSGTVFLKGRLEAEIAQMEEEDAAEFLSEFDIGEQSLTRAIRRCYSLLGLITFFTIGDKEVRAWAVRKGSKAPEAAGTVHSDMQAGFIRAETVHFDDLAASGSMGEARRLGRLRLEGRDYEVEDGDILQIRFNL